MPSACSNSARPYSTLQAGLGSCAAAALQPIQAISPNREYRVISGTLPRARSASHFTASAPCSVQVQPLPLRGGVEIGELRPGECALNGGGEVLAGVPRHDEAEGGEHVP